MTDDSARVFYREGQTLRAADLTAEQEYLIALEERHELNQHWRDGDAIVHAASVVHPAQHVDMLVGPLTGRDRNGFTVRVSDGKAMQQRIAAERFGANVLTGNVIVPTLSAGTLAAFAASDPVTHDPPLTCLGNVKAGTPAHPAEELRLDLGPKKDNDNSKRLAIGLQNNGFVELLTMTGKCAITVAGNDPERMVISVMGTLRRAPMKPDPDDPEFANALVQAWLSGLHQAVGASHVVSLAFHDLPPIIDTGQQWSYGVMLTNTSGQAINVDKPFETLTIDNGDPHYDRPLQAESGVGASHDYTVPHSGSDVAQGSLVIDFQVSGKIGPTTWYQAVTSGPIPVVNAPEVSFGVGNTVHVSNQSDRTLHVTSVNAVVVAVAIASGADADLSVQSTAQDATIEYKWDNADKTFIVTIQANQINISAVKPRARRSAKSKPKPR